MSAALSRGSPSQRYIALMLLQLAVGTDVGSHPESTHHGSKTTHPSAGLSAQSQMPAAISEGSVVPHQFMVAS